MEQQYSLMKFDPATGSEQPYPSHAKQWRTWHGQTAWLVNPWTGDKRRAEDVGSDPFGHLILPPGEPLLADTSTATVEVKLDASCVSEAWEKLLNEWKEKMQPLSDAYKSGFDAGVAFVEASKGL